MGFDHIRTCPDKRCIKGDQMDNFVVTISREYGSGGHDIGKRLAQLLKVPFYDKEIVDNMEKRVIAIEKGSIVRDDLKGVYGYES